MTIDHINLARIDLNLLVALDALLTERSVTRAAARVGLRQSAMSHNLARLRALLGDELLTRGPDGMRATPRADRPDAHRARADNAPGLPGRGVRCPDSRAVVPDRADGQRGGANRSRP